MTNQVIEAGNTKVDIVEENGIVTVRIHSEDAVVYMNDDLIWSVGNEKKEFKYIPKQFHDFILNNGVDHMEYMEKAKETSVDVYIDGESLTLYFPVNQKKEINARFNFITSVEEVKEYLLELHEEEKVKETLDELTKRFEAIRVLVESKGYKLGFSHAMGEWAYAWWDIVFQSADWNEESVKEIMKEVTEFNRFTNQIRDEFNI